MLLNCGVGEDSWESLDCKEIQPVHPRGDESSVFIRRTDAEAETPILWRPDAKNWPDSGKDWRWEEKGMTEDEMAGWHHQLDGHEFECTLGVGDGQEGLVCCNSWGRKESDTSERLNWTELNWRRQRSCIQKTIGHWWKKWKKQHKKWRYSMLLVGKNQYCENDYAT